MLEIAVAAARLAGQLTMEEINFPSVSVKNKTELVTKTDAKCQKIIIEQIKQRYPDHGFIAEETEQKALFSQPPRSAESLWWIIDPIDGTNNFAHGILSFTVSIAVFYNGEPVVGVIFEPATDSMYTAVKGDGAMLNGRKISTSSETINKFSSIGLDSHFDQPFPGWVCRLMEQTRFRNLGSTALHLAYVAKAGLIGAIMSQPKLWDVAAGALIAEAAGAVISDWDGKKIFPIDLKNYNGGQFQLIAAGRQIHTELLQIIKS